MNYKIGDVVTIGSMEITICGFTKSMKSFVGKHYKEGSGHSGSSKHYWHDEEGKPIPYIKGNSYFFYSIEHIKEKTEPQYEIY